MFRKLIWLGMLLAPLTATGQGRTMVRIDSTKPRDGFGFGASQAMAGTLNGTQVSQAPTEYPVIASVKAGSPADTAGLRPGDTILSADDKDLLQEPVRLNPTAGTRMRFRILRCKEVFEVTMVSVRIYTPKDSSNWKPRPNLPEPLH